MSWGAFFVFCRVQSLLGRADENIKASPFAQRMVTGFANAWPKQGYEIQVNNSHTDWRRTASVYGIMDTKETYVKDEEWFDLNVIVQGNHITTKINDKTIIEYTEPDSVAKGTDARRIQAGTIAIQAHDPNSKVVYQQIQVRNL